MPVLWPNGGSTPTPEAAGIRCTSEFGMRTHPVTGVPSTMHYGLDMVGWSIIIAPVTGVVSFAGYNGGAGNEVRIKADNGDVFRLLHNRELWVRTGQRVSQGQQVAVMGTTGSSTGVHCHEETRPGGGNAINPRDYYRAANSGSAAGGGGEPFVPEEEEFMRIILHKPTNKLLLVDDINKTIRDLGNSGSDITRDYYSRKPYISMDDAQWAAATKGYVYVNTPNAWDAQLQALDVNGNPIKGAAFPAAIYVAAIDAKVNDMRANGVKATGVTITDAQAKAIADQISAQVKGGATKAEVEGIVKAAFASLTLVTP